MSVFPPRRRDDPVPPDDEPTRSDLTDVELDAALAAGDIELLDHVRAHSNPAAVLSALLDGGPTSTSWDAAAPPSRRTDASPPRPALAAERILARSHARDLVTLIERACGRVPAFNGGVSLVLSRARIIALTLVHILQLVRALGELHRARELHQALSRAFALTGAAEQDRVLEQALDLARGLARDLAARPVDASGADLTAVRVSDLAVLDGVVWDEDTRWPLDLRERIVSRSEEIASGVYRVRGGTERDPHAVPGR
ncbi:hypothetical protein [Actinomadura decatromicini]|uniref:Uncharacterized protein n=1 Tax=Actinomadura decatromicini TaxID=2604572 RepID=A0A5D3F752_9ACTN|nr:hypothetical protein [Actinomadura decatromicini]TYK44013.1 hypothetical protein FXF68_35425 [Actinomadura decatromicini]